VRSLLGFLLSLSVAVSVFAQDATALRGDGGELSVLVKRPSQLSGTFGFTFGGNRSNALTGSVGGTLVPDRVWFFASAQRDQHPLWGGFSNPPAPGSGGLEDPPHIRELLHFTSMVSPSAFFSVSASQNSTK